MVLVASSVSIGAQTTTWRTAVYADDPVSYFLGASQPPSDWTATTFDDSDWPAGRGGLGYGDDDDNTVIPAVTSVYVRYSFDIADAAAIVRAVFHADYDDGFVAFLNGVEIARANILGQSPPFFAQSPAAREALLYQGGLPETYIISEIDDLLQDGKNVLAVQTHNFQGASSSDMTSLYWLSVGFDSESTAFGAVPDWFAATAFTTSLPIMSISTGGTTIVDEPEIAGRMDIIHNNEGRPNSLLDVPLEYSGSITVEKRGQSSLDLFPKNGYGIELKDSLGNDMDAGFLGMPPEEDWILHGPYTDKTLIRNMLAMHLASELGQYASRTQALELFVNGQYEGIYVLMEQIKRNDDRVDVSRLRPEETTGDDVTGGYIFKVDKGEVDWESRYNTAGSSTEKLKFQHVYPRRENIVPEQAAYIQAYVDSFEIALRSPTASFGGKGLSDYVDLASFADHFLVTELSKDVDAYRISSYFHKDKDSVDGRLKAGPVWDFNLAFGNAEGCTAYETDGWMVDVRCAGANPFWWEVLKSNTQFANIAACRWNELRAGPYATDAIMDFIDQQEAALAVPAQRNFERWPVLGEIIWPNPLPFGFTYAEEIDYLKDYVDERLRWMDANMIGICITSVSDPQEVSSVDVFPNPTNGHISIRTAAAPVGNVEIYDANGQRVLQEAFSRDLDISHLPTGMYLLKLRLQTGSVYRRVVKAD